MASEMSRLKQGGFVKRPNRKGLDGFVEGYLKMVTSGNRLREERKFIEKAIMMINEVFGQPCCSVAGGAVIGPNLTTKVSLITPHDNQLTNTIRELILNGHIIRRTYRYSLERTLTLLNDYLYGCCVSPLTILFDPSITPADAIIQGFDVVTNQLIFTTTALDGIAKVTSVPSKYFGPGSIVKICINNATLPSLGTSTKVIDNVNSVTIASSSVLGQVCGSVLEPLQSSYIVKRS